MDTPSEGAILPLSFLASLLVVDSSRKEIVPLNKILSFESTPHLQRASLPRETNRKSEHLFLLINPIALRKAKIVYNFGLSGCKRVKPTGYFPGGLVDKTYLPGC